MLDYKILFAIFFVAILVFVIVMRVRVIVKNKNSKETRKAIKNNINLLKRGMTRKEVKATMGVAPLSENEYEMVYRVEKLRQNGGYDREDYVLKFDANNKLTDVSTSNSYKHYY